MDESGPPSSARRSGSRHGRQPPPPFPPQRSVSTRTSCAVGTAVGARRTTGGKAVNLPPSGAARTRRSSALAANHAPPTTEVTPIPAPQRKPAPKLITHGDSAAIRASIDIAALENSSDDEAVDEEEYD